MKPLLFALFVLLCQAALHGYDVRIRVVDESGQPVSGASANIMFVMYRTDSDVEKKGLTDAKGAFRAKGRGRHSVSVAVAKDGHYPARLRRLPNNTDLNLEIVLPRIRNPQPLHTKAIHTAIPVQNEWLGFDFELGDWVKPHGKGETRDILFRFKNEFLAWKQGEEEMAQNRKANNHLSEDELKKFYGIWDARLEIAFPGEKEGLIGEAPFLTYSLLKLPHLAPEDGYVATRQYEATSRAQRNKREDTGIFLRSRVKLDNDQGIVSANYTKIIGEIQLIPQGHLNFTCYFNPTPNDRNLEWDPKRNLTQGLTNEQTPRDP